MQAHALEAAPEKRFWYGRVNGTMMMLFALAGAFGPLVTGYLFDLLGRYREGILLLAATFVLSCLFAAALGRMRRPGGEAA